MRGCRLKLCLVGACACALFLACSSGDDDELLIQSIAIDEGLSSSTVPESSSSAVPESSDGISSSSSFVSSSSRRDFGEYYGNSTILRWEGYESPYRMNTGHDNGTETSGHWYAFSDQHDGGNSSIEWPVETDVILGDDLGDGLDSVIEACGGVCGTFKLDAGEMTSKPFVGIAFNVAGREKGKSGMPYGEALDVADVVKWGGICITYTVDVVAVLELSMGRARDSALVGFDLPYVTLPKATYTSDICASWGSFKQGGWGTGKITGEEIAKNLATVRFKILAEDGAVGTFNVMSISEILLD
jgi:hypothetical protein